MTDWLATRCKELAQRSHPIQSQRTIAACFSDEQPVLRSIMARFDGYARAVGNQSLMQIRQIKTLLKDPNIRVIDIAKQYGVCRATVFNAVGAVKPVRLPN